MEVGGSWFENVPKFLAWVIKIIYFWEIDL
jgi:hypothetical protein